MSYGNYSASINKKVFSINNSYISIARTVFICLLLAIGAFCFAKDAQDLVLRPIERMLIKVNNISKNPLASKYQKLIEKPDIEAQHMETNFIENAIIKISTLLVLGLGDAGSEIITSNIAKMGDLVCITPGNKRYGIFGFCDIRNFTDSTEVLQEDVMLFVNNIAEIVHTIVDRFQGSANKNIGDAFLLVWKFRIEDYPFIEEKLKLLWKDPKEMNEIKLSFIKENTWAVKNYHNSSISDLTDLSLMSFLKIICKINRKAKILQYSTNSSLNSRFNGYKVRMGFGLHLGWAIEGSIGSDYKIDASYLSPNVNIASRLEAATKQYGVPILISHTVYEFLSIKMKQITRKIDVITVKGSRSPLTLFTVDLEVDNLPYKEQSIKTSKEIREINVLKKMGVAFGLEDKTFPFEELFNFDKDISLALKPMQEEIQIIFNEGIEEYLKGNWKKAEELLEKSLFYKENDGPCKNLLDFMGSFNFKCPTEWMGFRELVDK